MKPATRGAVAALLYVAMAGGVATAIGSTVAYFRGYSKAERLVTDERNAHWQGQIQKMLDLHADALRAEQARVREAEARMGREVVKIGEVLEHERQETARLRGDLATAVRRRDELRSALDSYAAGDRPADQDSVAACRDRAETLGRVLEGVLLSHRECSLDAEEAAAGQRALRKWSNAVTEAVNAAQPTNP